MSDEQGAADLPRRDRSSLRAANRPKRGRGRAIAAAIASVIWEVVGEILFLVLVGLVSWLVYEELRWPFIAAVFLGVNAVLVVIALIAWARRRRSREPSRGRPRGGAEGDTVRNRTGR